MPEWHQLDCMSGHVKESETSKILQLYATSSSTSVSTRLKHGLSRKVLQEKKNRTKFGEIEFQQETHDMITMEIVMTIFMFAMIS